MTTSFSDIHELVKAVDLADVVVHEERGRRLTTTVTQPTEGRQAATKVVMAVNVAENTMRFRFRFVLADGVAEYVAEAEAVYVAAGLGDIEVGPELQKEFAQRVAFMTVYPFLRASIHGSASRLGCSRPVLGLIRQGDFEPGEPLTDAEAQAAFFDNRAELGSP